MLCACLVVDIMVWWFRYDRSAHGPWDCGRRGSGKAYDSHSQVPSRPHSPLLPPGACGFYCVVSKVWLALHPLYSCSEYSADLTKLWFQGQNQPAVTEGPRSQPILAQIHACEYSEPYPNNIMRTYISPVAHRRHIIVHTQERHITEPKMFSKGYCSSVTASSISFLCLHVRVHCTSKPLHVH